MPRKANPTPKTKSSLPVNDRSSSVIKRLKTESSSTSLRPSTPNHARPMSVLGAPGEFNSPRNRSPMRPRSSVGIRVGQDMPKGNFKVVVRARPYLQRELAGSKRQVISMDARDQSTTIKPPTEKSAARRNNESRKFYFDKSFWSVDERDPHHADQSTVYNEIGKEFLTHNLQGYNTCIFAYGQTGSGKTYTMMGSGVAGDSESDGIIPRTCKDLFSRIEELMNENVSCSVRLSYFEVYNEHVRDLLAPLESKGHLHNLKVRESPTDGPYVEDLSEYTVKDASQVLKYIKHGNKARSTAATNMNDQSSRSHAVVTLSIKQIHYHPDMETTEEKKSQMRLVDLAGSERVNSTGATGERFREGSNINKSLSTLGRVIACLASPNNNHQLVPYRDSVLTWLLKESLGGNSKTAMVACVSPADYDESLSTLRYADQAKRIRTRAVINQDILSGADKDKLVLEMQEQIASLQHSLSSYQQRNEEDTLKQEMHKVRQAIKFYEDRAIAEENKRRTIQAELQATTRHNRMLVEYLKEVTNKTTNGLEINITNDDYSILKKEQENIQKDLSSLRTSFQESKTRFHQRLNRLNAIY